MEDLVRARMDRRRVLESSTSPVLWAILHEATLLAPMGGPKVMRHQLLHLAELAQWPKVVIQVLPFTATAGAFMAGMTSIMSFYDAPTIVYTEGGGSGTIIEDPALVEMNARTYDPARAAALSPSASRARIESPAKDYGSR